MNADHNSMPNDSRGTARAAGVLATDLDGTLIPLDGNAENRQDLEVLRQRLVAESVTLTFVSGRHLALVQQAMQTHDLPVPNWIICDVGTTIYRRTDADSDAAGAAPESRVPAESEDAWEELPAYRDHLKSLCAQLPIDTLRTELQRFEALELQEEEKQGRFKLSYYVDREDLHNVASQIQDWISDADAPYSLICSVDPFTGSGLIDLLPKRASKAYAMEWWCSNCGYEKEQIVFAGDSGNDLAALTAGYRAIVVGNADRELAREVQQEHERQGWSHRLYLATESATSAVLAGCRWFHLV